MITSDFWLEFKATLDNDAFWETLDVTVDIEESAFETLGAIAKKVQQGGPLTLVEIQRLSIAVEKVSAWSADFAGRIDSTTARPLTPDEMSLVRFIRQERAPLEVVAVQLRQTVDSVNVGGLTPERASAVASKVVPFLRKAGPLLGAAHVLWAGVSEGPSKATASKGVGVELFPRALHRFRVNDRFYGDSLVKRFPFKCGWLGLHVGTCVDGASEAMA